MSYKSRLNSIGPIKTMKTTNGQCLSAKTIEMARTNCVRSIVLEMLNLLHKLQNVESDIVLDIMFKSKYTVCTTQLAYRVLGNVGGKQEW